ncbi:MAG TPA: adenylyl-sulfate kinase [Anaeromyxobacteraceae bacterium]|nr:adenylyl-sulfate kinase [Anaeromyxobacteraceae bacterium]
MDAHQVTGFVIWLTGMVGAGKTTLGNQVVKRFTAAGRPVEFLDGDDPDGILTRGLGVSKEDRDTAVRRLGVVAKMLARHGAAVVVASLSPYREARDAVRRDVRRFAEVFVDAPMETLLARDGEGLYKKALAHELTNVAGIDDPYEPPSHPELVVRTDQEKPDAAASRLFQKLVDMKLLAPAEFVRLSGGQRPKRAAPPKAAKGAKKGAQARKGSAKAKPARAAKRARR